MQIIRGAIQGINNPLTVIIGPGLGTAFLGEYAVVGIDITQRTDNFLFCLNIHFANKIIALFGVDREPVQAVHMPQNDLSSAQSGTNGDSNGRMHGDCL